MAYAICFNEETNAYLGRLTARQLLHEPAIETRNRKRMQADRPGFVAPWELRIGDLRV